MVFLSYRHENDEHRARVKALALDLKLAGIEVVLDQFYMDENPGGPDGGWPHWCSEQVKTASKILIIASNGWFKCFEKKEAPGTGLGAACETHQIRQELYDASWNTNKHRLVSLDTATEYTITTELRSYHRFNGEKPNEMAQLIQWLKPASPMVSAAGEATPSWPELPADFVWPFADTLHVRDAFKQLLTEHTSHRALLIRGDSEVGKTSITNHLLGLAMRITGLTCGRLDLKGLNSLEKELLYFTDCLLESTNNAEEVLGNGNTTEKLRSVMRHLQSKSQPTLLIIDTYDDAQAREYAEWIEGSLLLGLNRKNWLRVVIAGQRVPAAATAAWSSDTKFLELKPPSCEDWIEQARKSCPETSETSIKDVFRLAEGKAGLISLLIKTQLTQA